MQGRPLILVPFAPQDAAQALADDLGNQGYQISIHKDTRAASSTSLSPCLAVLLLAKDWPRTQVTQLLHNLQQPLLVLTYGYSAQDDKEITTRCIDSLDWPCCPVNLGQRIAHMLGVPVSPEAAERQQLSSEFHRLNMVGATPAFLGTARLIKKIARCDVSVLIEGETGTGKELAARAIHYLGARADYPFIPVNCGAIPDNLMENEWFGHEKGAFTDAREAQPGLVALAEGGSLFLDEVDTLSPKAQITLLRFLQDQGYRPLGSKQLKKADVRIIAASNADLNQLVESGNFRQDLLYRLNIMALSLPSLRERPADIELMAEYFMQRYRILYNTPLKYLSAQAKQRLSNYSWPGNVRELENFIHRQFLLTEDNSVYVPDPLSEYEDRRQSNDRRTQIAFEAAFSTAKAQVINHFERQYLAWLMNEVNGNVTLAAKRAGKERRALGKLLKKHGIHRHEYTD